MCANIPEPIRRRGRANALIYGVGVLAVLGLLTAGIWALFRQSPASSVTIAAGVLWVGLFTVFLVGWLHAKATVGPLLLDCGPHPTKNLFLFSAVFFLLFFGAGGLVRFLARFDAFGLAGAVFGLTSAIYYVVFALGRLQIRENGIWPYCELLKWDRLQWYRWEGDSLLLHAKTRFPFLGKGALPVPSEHKLAVEEFLARHGVACSDP